MPLPAAEPAGAGYNQPGLLGGGQEHLQIRHSAALIFFVTGLAQVRRRDGTVDDLEWQSSRIVMQRREASVISCWAGLRTDRVAR